MTRGEPEAGPIAKLPQSDRFGWLAAPSSTIVQASEVHTGLSEEPAATLQSLFERLVAPVADVSSLRAAARPQLERRSGVPIRQSTSAGDTAASSASAATWERPGCG